MYNESMIVNSLSINVVYICLRIYVCVISINICVYIFKYKHAWKIKETK